MTDTLVELMPAAGARVRKPNGALLALDGEPVPLSAYWRRRLRDGDVVRVEETPRSRMKGSK